MKIIVFPLCELVQVNPHTESFFFKRIGLCCLYKMYCSITFIVLGRRGRPGINITREHIDFLMKQGHTIKKMAKMLGCSSSFLYKKSKLMGLPIRGRLSALDDNQLQEHVWTLQGQFPNSGNEVCFFYSIEICEITFLRVL